MRVVIAPDKFKESLTAIEAAKAMARGVAATGHDFEVDLAPMADGGEGTVDALVAATGGTERRVMVTGPFGEAVEGRVGLLGDGRTAVIEMASASGLALVPADKRNPMIASTRGTGELLLEAIRLGARKIIIGIGGSATNDGGAGLGQALGFRLLDGDGNDLEPGGASLDRLAQIDSSDRRPELSGVEIAVACDVTNPLCGPRGASVVYGPQKGATPQMVETLDRNLAHFAAIVERDLGVAIKDQPGSGAAGGLGGGLIAFAGGHLQPGIELVIEAVGLASRLAGADLCLTGEGGIDDQSAFGKTVVGVSRLARSLGCPTLALAGTIKPGAEAVLDEGIDAYFSICPGPVTLDEAKSQAAELLDQATAQAVRAFLAGTRSPKGPKLEDGSLDETPKNLTEFGLIDWIRERQGASPRHWKENELGIGDDCAVLRILHNTELLVTTDMLMDGRHFRLEEAGAEAVGYKAMGVNLSDIAAMAGIPRAAVVSVALPRNHAAEIARGLHEGMRALADEYRVDMVGGDTNAWDGPLVINISLLGETTALGAVRRSGALAGDAILVTGPLGGSLASDRHLRPRPRIWEAIELRQFCEIHAMIDLSDGLASDLPHILEESGGLGAILDAAAIPIHADALALSGGDPRLALDRALTDGEDFELCLTVSPSDAARLAAEPPPGVVLYRIGEITREIGLWLRDAAGRMTPVTGRGFDHLLNVP